MEEERGRRLRGHHLLDLLQQHALPGPRHRRLLLLAQELQPHRVSFCYFVLSVIPIWNMPYSKESLSE